MPVEQVRQPGVDGDGVSPAVTVTGPTTPEIPRPSSSIRGRSTATTPVAEGGQAATPVAGRWFLRHPPVAGRLLDPLTQDRPAHLANTVAPRLIAKSFPPSSTAARMRSARERSSESAYPSTNRSSAVTMAAYSSLGGHCPTFRSPARPGAHPTSRWVGVGRRRVVPDDVAGLGQADQGGGDDLAGQHANLPEDRVEFGRAGLDGEPLHRLENGEVAVVSLGQSGRSRHATGGAP